MSVVRVNQAKAAEIRFREMASRVQGRLDAFARSREYENIMSLCSHASSTVPAWAAEGQYGVKIRDETWVRFFEVAEAVKRGERPVPTWDELEAELPVLKWPT